MTYRLFSERPVIKLDPRDLSSNAIGRYFFQGNNIASLANKALFVELPKSEEEEQKELYKQQILRVQYVEPFLRKYGVRDI